MGRSMEKTSRKHRAITAVLSRPPLSLLARLAQPSLLIPYYHLVSDDERPHIKHLFAHKSVAQFEHDIDFLARNYRPVSMQDLLDALPAGRTVPEKCFHVTFDDGFSEMHDIVAPILSRKGIPATFFLNSAFIDNRELCHHHKASVLAEAVCKRPAADLPAPFRKRLNNGSAEQDGITGFLVNVAYEDRGLLDELAAIVDVDFSDYLARQRPYLTSDDVRSLIRQGFAVGGHSVDHPLFAGISLPEQLRQTVESVKFIRERFRVGYGVFAFPQSDRAVTREYFSRLAGTGMVDLTFGTGGMMTDGVATNLQRFSMEYPPLPAEDIIAYQTARRLRKIISGRAKIERE